MLSGWSREVIKVLDIQQSKIAKATLHYFSHAFQNASVFKLSDQGYYFLSTGVLVPKRDVGACVGMAHLLERNVGLKLWAVARTDGKWTVRAEYADHSPDNEHLIRTLAPSLRLALSVIVNHLGYSY